MAINYHDGGGNNPYVPDFTNISVVPEDLAEFADLLDGDLAAIKDTWEQVSSDLASQPPPNFPGEVAGSVSYASGYPQVLDTGSGGLWEAGEFREAYFRTLKAREMLVEDLIRGLEILRDAARMIHDGYVVSDAANADNLTGGFAAYERSAVIEALDEPDERSGG